MSIYGTFEGKDHEKYDAADPIHCALGLCRMLGLRYEIKRSTYGNNKWIVSLSISDWPADFYSHTKAMHPTHIANQLTVVGCEEADILHALHQCISAAFGNLRDSCEHWRRIAKTHPDYKHWPQFKDPVCAL